MDIKVKLTKADHMTNYLSKSENKASNIAGYYLMHFSYDPMGNFLKMNQGTAMEGSELYNQIKEYIEDCK